MKFSRGRTPPYSCNITIQPGDIVFAVDAEGLFVYWNANARTATGLAAAAVAGRPMVAVFPEHEGGPDRARFDLAAVIAGRDYSGGFQLHRPDGSPATIYVYATVGLDDSGAPAGAVFVGRDVTNSIEVEHAARTSEEKYRALARLASEFVLMFDPGGRILEVNRALAVATGTSEARLLAMEFAELVEPERRQYVQAQVARLRAQRELRITLDLLTAAGHRLRVEFNAAMMTLPGREVAIAVGRDVSERAQDQQRVADSEQKYSRIFAAVRDGIFLQTIDGRIIDANAGACRLLALTRPELLARRVEDLVPSSARLGMARLRESVLRDEEFYGEGTALRADGGEVPVELSCSLVELGGEALVIMLMRDIGERRRAEQALRDSEENFRQLAENALDGILIATGPERHDYANRRAAEITGYTPAELLKIGFVALAHPDEVSMLKERYERRMRGEKPATQYETRILSKAGETVPIEITAARTMWQGVPADLVVVRDIRERIRARRVLEESEALHRLTLDAMSDPAHVVDRDLRIVLFNSAFRRWMAGFGVAGDPVGRTVFEVFPFLPDKVRQEYEQVFATGEQLCTEETSRVVTRKVETETCKLPIVEAGAVSRVLTIVRDIGARRRAAEVLERLAGTAMGFVELEPGADVFLYLGERLEELLPDHVFAVNEVDDGDAVLTVRRVAGLTEDETAGAARCLGGPLEGAVFSGVAPDVRDVLVTGMLAEVEDGIHGALLGRVPEPACRDLAAALDIERVESIGLRRQDRVYGNITFFLRPGQELDRRLVETFAGQCSIALEQREAAVELTASEERYSLLVNRSPIGICRTTPDGRIRTANPALVRMLGYGTFDDLARRNLDDTGFQAGYDRTEFKRRLETEGSITGLETTWTRADGTELHIRENARVVRGPGGQVEYYEGTVEDLTERHRAEELVLRERERAQSYLMLAGVILVALDERGRVTLINRRGCQVLGVTEEQARGSDWFESFIPAANRERVRATFESLMRGEDEVTGEFENPVVNAAGEERLVVWENVLLRDEAGRITGTLSSGEDVTGRRRAEEARAESEEQYRRVVDGALDGICLIRDGALLYVNPQVTTLSGYPADQLTGRPFVEFLAPGERDRVLDFYRRRQAGEDVPEVYETAFLRRDGTRCEVELKAGIVAYRGGPAELVFIRDITERKSAEARVGVLLESIPSAVIYQTGGGVEYLSPNIREMLGYTAEELARDRTIFPGLIHALDRAGVDADFGRWLKAGAEGVHTKEFRVRHRDGRWLWLRDHTRLAFITADGRRSTLGVMVDVTARHEAEDELRASREQLRELQDNVPLGLFRTTPDGRFISVNRAAVEMFGYSSEEAMKAAGVAALYADPAERKELLARLARGRLVNVEMRARRQDGTGFAGLLSVNPVLDDSGAPCCHDGIIEDITDRRAAEAALRASEERYRRLVELSPDGIAVHQDGRIVMVNPAGARTLGYDSPDEMVGRPVLDFVHTDDRSRVIERVRQVVETGKTGSLVRERFLRKDGTVVAVEVVNSPFTWQGRPAVLVVVRDISSRRG